MKILFILHLPPPIHGASTIGKYISESKLINKTFKTRFINLSTSYTIDEIGKKGWIKVFRYFKIIHFTFYEIIFNRPKICYITISSRGLGLYKDLPLIILLKLFRVKILYHFHNKGVKLNEDRFFDNLIYKFTFKNIKLILLSNHLYCDVSKYISEKDIYYCANGITAENKKIIKNNTKIRILVVSNLIKSKGILDVLEVCHTLNNKNFVFQCDIIGDEGDISKTYLLDKIKSLNLHNVVLYHGKKTGNEKDYFFKNADIFFHPTRNDCFPLVILEAMKFKCAIVTTREGAIPEIIDHLSTGYLAEKENHQEMLQYLESLMTNIELRNIIAETAYHKFESRYRLEQFELRFNNILLDVIK